ncbi:MAG: SIS domain-containing protein [Candidatus Latescibacterota bacterium]|nr:MAG: SIS domain-containing protein [Candidatus Latescibacterota bacterium]
MPNNEFDLKTSLTTRKQLLDWLVDHGWPEIHRIADLLTQSLRRGGAVFSCGNGGSASQAEHFAAELAGRYNLDRKSLPVFALSTNSASVTAITNDYGFSEMFARQLEGIGKDGDCLLALSTSGDSKNIIRACQVASSKSMRVFGLTGKSGGLLAAECDRTIRIPETDTARIQEMHLVILHLICQYIEEQLFSPEPAKKQTV